MIFQMTAKKVFGANYERLKKSILVWAIVFWGLRAAGMQVEIAAFILYLMTSAFTAGVMWLALSSEDNKANMMNLFMMPFERKVLNASYVSALGLYTLATKTLGLLCVAWAVSDWSAAEILGSVLCAVNAVWMCGSTYVWSKSLRYGPVRISLWCGCVLVLLQIQDFVPLFGSALLVANAGLAFLLTLRADSYAFYRREGSGVLTKRPVRGTSSGLVCRYLLRYMTTHRNYLFNTIIMWGVACVLPVFLGQVGGITEMVSESYDVARMTEWQFIMPIGFAIVTMNTPICILLSCDPALEQAVRFLPGQKRAFFLPYGSFLFLCNMTAETIYLCSWQLFFGGVSGHMVLTAACFALLGAAGSTLLEWFCPIRGWKIESDLWHHPRKYIVPGILLLLAVAVGS